MSDKPIYLLNVSLDVDKEHEDCLNEVYEHEHVPALLKVPGVVSIRRYRRQALKIALGGAIIEPVFDSEPTYTTLYELESPNVVISADWAQAVELGRWPREVRPFTQNRRHTLHSLIRPKRQ